MAALSRQGKEETLSKLVPLLESSTVVVGLRYQGLSVKQMQEFRASLPQDGAKLLVCKNTLLRRAADEVEGWSDLKSAAKGDNAWLFIQEEFVADSIKAYVKFQDKVKEGVPKDQRDSFVPLTVTGGAMSGNAIGPADIQRLKNLPNKKELIATIARLIKQVPTKVAVSVKQVPTKLAYGIKALADADDDTSKVVGDVLPATETASE
jgi:large subunit ribosomal protein L10